ncbi:hypothetical protein PG990_009318 [Apiospora arundinis]
MRRLFSRRKGNKRGAPDGPPGPSVASASASSRSSTPTPSRAFPSGIKLLHCPLDCTVDVVFVHGLTGDREQAWTAHNESEPWPQTLLPSRLPTARVLTFGYDVSVADWKGMVSQSRIANHAGNLLSSLAAYRDDDDTNKRPIVFVCHSLGGLVCEDRPDAHLRNILHSTRGIVFLGTPHHGAGLAQWAEQLARHLGMVKQTNRNIVDVLKRDSEVLARIQDSFHTMVRAQIKEGLQPMEITCFYEELPVLGVGLIVPQDSAILPGCIPIGIRANHIDMTKFAAVDDAGFVAVSAELRRWVKNLAITEAHLESLPLRNVAGSASGAGPAEAVRQLVTGDGPAIGRDKTCYYIPFDENQQFTDRDIALVGLGGVGKTQVALRFVYWVKKTDPKCSILWIPAFSDASIEQAYTEVAKQFTIQKATEDEDMKDSVRRYLNSTKAGNWLLIIDNTDDPHQLKRVQSHLPKNENGVILFTLRSRKVAGHDGGNADLKHSAVVWVLPIRQPKLPI